MTRFRVRPWALVLAWSAVIFLLSTAAFSGANTSSFLVPLFHRFFPGASLDKLYLLNHLIRKAAHVTEYFIFGWLLLIAVRGPEQGWKLRWALLALLIAGGYSATDEWHQSFVPGRNSSAWDAMLDTAGAAIAMAATWVAFRRQHPYQSHSDGTNVSP